MRRLLLLPVLLGALALGACSSDSKESAFCKQVRGVVTGDEQVLPTGNTDEINAEQANAELESLKAKAPAELKDDIEVLIEANAALDSGDVTVLNEPAFINRFTAAVENFNDYATNTCKVQPEE